MDAHPTRQARPSAPARPPAARSVLLDAQHRSPGAFDRPHQQTEHPRLMVKSFSSHSFGPDRAAPPARRSSSRPAARLSETDKSTELRQEEQDKILGFSTFAAHPRGVNIVVDASTGSTTAKRAGRGAGIGAAVGGGLGLIGGIAGLAGGALGLGVAAGLLLGGAALGAIIGGIAGALAGQYRFTQTIDTNVPLGGSSSPYVDPRPNDDDKPFYWTDAEHRQHGTRFIDRPSRGVPSSGTTDWDATLSITHVEGKSVSILESLKYGFSLDSAGTVTTRAPVSTSSVATHVSTLAASFPDWSFRQS